MKGQVAQEAPKERNGQDAKEAQKARRKCMELMSQSMKNKEKIAEHTHEGRD
jgi:hypothetical protein